MPSESRNTADRITCNILLLTNSVVSKTTEIQTNRLFTPYKMQINSKFTAFHAFTDLSLIFAPIHCIPPYLLTVHIPTHQQHGSGLRSHDLAPHLHSVDVGLPLVAVVGLDLQGDRVQHWVRDLHHEGLAVSHHSVAVRVLQSERLVEGEVAQMDLFLSGEVVVLAPA